MSSIARGGDAITTGHISPCDTVSTIMSSTTAGDTNGVYADGIGIACVGDLITLHGMNDPSATASCIPHADATINAGSSTVFVGGIPVGRVGDSADAGVITSGSATVNAG